LQRCCLDEENNRLDHKNIAPTAVEIGAGAPNVVGALKEIVQISKAIAKATKGIVNPIETIILTVT
jgi:hypothetical protein